jgi:tyrosine-protein phosphatase SIW14
MHPQRPSFPALLAAALLFAALPARADKELPNFAIVAPGIYRGAAPTAEGMRRLKRMGVQTIIDLRIERRGQKEEAAQAKALHMERLRLPMGREAPTHKQVATFLQTLDAAAERPVFVHCQHGADRTGAMIGIWRVTRQGWEWDRAWAEMSRYGFKPYLRELKASVFESQATFARARK